MTTEKSVYSAGPNSAPKKRPIRTALRATKNWLSGILSSSIILGILFFIIINFYVFSSIVNLNTFFYAFLMLSLLTDGLFIFAHLPRRTGAKEDHAVSFNPDKLTVVIACHNGEDVIERTVREAMVHVPANQIIVVSDASSDNTVDVARKTGVRVIDNKENLHKVGSINFAMQYVRTPYVLILDDDTLIGKTLIPTSLLDEGYTAVAFNVMPVKEKTLINELQRFEYRTSMQVGKNLRAKVGAIGNVSGAIGLYHTSDLRKQIAKHSGQFAGEDEQRTLLAHLHGQGKGITYTDSLVLTVAPDTYRDLFKQRAFSWSLSVPELFVMYWRVLLSSRFHYLLKAEKAYLIYIYLTDPLRILFCWTLIMHPSHLTVAYGFYLILNVLIWFRMGCRDTLRSVIFSPLYALGLTLSRFIGHFYWLKEKSLYLAKGLHRKVDERNLLMEYTFVLLVVIGSWVMSIQHFRNELHMFDKIRTESQLTSNEDAFSYNDSQSYSSVVFAAAPADAPYVRVQLEKGDTNRAIAHKAVDAYLAQKPVSGIESQRWRIDDALAAKIPPVSTMVTGEGVEVNKQLIEQALAVAQTPVQENAQ